MQRALLLVGCLAFGAVAVYFAIQTLQDNAEVAPADAPAQEQQREGGGRSVVVRITDEGFQPRAVSIRAGQTVRWVNDDDSPHAVEQTTGPGSGFGSDRLAPDDVYSRTFVDLGRFGVEDPRNPDAPRGEVNVTGD